MAHHPSRGRAAALARLVLILALAWLPAACSDSADPAASSNAAASAAASPSSPPSPSSPTAAPTTIPASVKKGEKAARHPSERPVPNFEGQTTTGERVTMSGLLGGRVVLFFFDPSNEQAAPVARAVSEINAKAADNNFRVVGIGLGSSTVAIRDFVAAEKLAFPVIDDSSGGVKNRLRLNAPLAILGVDADGYVGFGFSYFPKDATAEAATRDQLAAALRVKLDEASDGALYAWPEAPALGVLSMSDGKKLETKDLAGKPAIVIFFLHTCPHCHKALEAIRATLDGMPEEGRPELVAISVQNDPGAVRSAMKDLGLTFFDPYLDPGSQAADAWGVTGGVPVVNVVDAEGRIRHRTQGWNDRRDAALLRMNVAKASGQRVPMILDPKGYSGNDVCGVCHEQEYATWQFTTHSTAFDTLVKHEADRRKDCIGCHVVGYEDRGGYDFTRRQPHLEDVGCESCHGRGGVHLSPDFVPTSADGGKDYESVCSTCHNPTHSLGFEYASFHERVSHTRIASLGNAERAQLAGGAGPARDLLPTTADYVGSEACQSCHAKEFETWTESPHGHAVATLEKEGKASDPECLACHTTAYAKTGGFPAGAPVADHPDLARVGCESCHGPGGDHVGADARRVGTILSLGDKCDSCVILKVCGTCHDDANDPGFRFAVEERIDAQRHGTIESAATRAGQSAFHDATHAGQSAFHDATHAPGDMDAEAAHAHSETLDRALLRHAFEHGAPAPAAAERG